MVSPEDMRGRCDEVVRGVTHSNSLSMDNYAYFAGGMVLSMGWMRRQVLDEMLERRLPPWSSELVLSLQLSSQYTANVLQTMKAHSVIMPRL